MTHVDTLVPAGTAGPPRPPGFLLTPFGWAAEPLAAMAAAEPSLLADLFAISRPQMLPRVSMRSWQTCAARVHQFTDKIGEHYET